MTKVEGITTIQNRRQERFLTALVFVCVSVRRPEGARVPTSETSSLEYFLLAEDHCSDAVAGGRFGAFHNRNDLAGEFARHLF